MRESPAKFPPRAAKALEQASELVRDDDSEVQRERWLDSPLNQRATLEAVLALQQQVEELAEQLRDLRENRPKRGIFG